MRVKLKHLKLSNFKGIKDLFIDFKENTEIYGNNGTGKTTIFDAYSWLLWDKDSLNRKDFGIKPWLKNGEETHNLESIVEGVLLVDDKEVILTKVYKEVWTKKRGQLTETFTGNTTDYYINSVPVKKTDYNKRISEIFNEETFYLLSNLKYFNEVLDKQKRKEILFNFIDEVKKDDLIKVNENLKKLDLENYTVDELRSMAKSTAKKINQDIDSIPARIDELIKSKNDFDFTELEKDREKIEKELLKLDEQIQSTSKISDTIKEKSTKISELEEEKRKLIKGVEEAFRKKQEEIDERYYKNKSEHDNKVSELKSKISEHEVSLSIEYSKKSNVESEIEMLDKLIKELRKQYETCYSEQFDGSLVCPTCNREYDSDKKNEIIEAFNLSKSNNLETIMNDGKNKKIELENRKKTLESIKLAISSLEGAIKTEKQNLADLGEFTIQKATASKIEEPARVKEIDEEIQRIEQEIKEVAQGDNTALVEERAKKQSELNSIIGKLALDKQNEELDKRIKDYESKEKELAKEFEKQQEIIFLCEEYVKTYSNLVEDKVNSMFDFVKFKLFETQINGGILETCEVTYNGVPYWDLNSAMKINAGLDIINAFSKKLDIYVPVFIDNAESITEPRKLDTQTIKLTVNKNDKELNII